MYVLVVVLNGIQCNSLEQIVIAYQSHTNHIVAIAYQSHSTAPLATSQMIYYCGWVFWPLY